MKNFIEHMAFVELYNKDKNIFNNLFNGTLTLSSFISKMNKISKNFKNFSYKSQEKMNGDIFEIFAEGFFTILGAHNSIGVNNYKPVKSTDDNGVDGFGLGIDNNPLTVQVKFRSDPTLELVSDDLKQFGFQSIAQYKVKLESDGDKKVQKNMIIFTTAKGLHWHTDNNVFLGLLRTINYNDIDNIIKNNNPFWNDFKDLIENTIKIKYS